MRRLSFIEQAILDIIICNKQMYCAISVISRTISFEMLNVQDNLIDDDEQVPLRTLLVI